MQGQWKARAIGGGPLVGDHLVRLVYLDEAGISAGEKTVVVAGVILKPDTQFPLLETALNALTKDYVPEDRRDGFVWHTKDLIWGGKKNTVFDAKKTTPEERWPILEELLAIPRQLGLPFIAAAFDKSLLKESRSAHEQSIQAHAIAYAGAMVTANLYMREFANTEWTMVFAEDRPEAKGMIKIAHNLMRNVGELKGLMPDLVFHERLASHVREGVNFCQKSESMALQMADGIACIVRRALDGSKDNERFMKALFGTETLGEQEISLRQQPVGRMIWVPKDEASLAGLVAQ